MSHYYIYSHFFTDFLFGGALSLQQIARYLSDNESFAAVSLFINFFHYFCKQINRMKNES